MYLRIYFFLFRSVFAPCGLRGFSRTMNDICTTRPGLVASYDIRPGNGAGVFLSPRNPHGAKPGLVVLYDIRPGNGAGPFLQPRSPHGAVATKECVDNNKYRSTRSLNVTKSQLNRTFLKVSHNSIFVFEIFTTQTTAKQFVV